MKFSLLSIPGSGNRFVKSTMTKIDNFFSRVYAMTRKIPRGRVSTYGQIAVLIGAPGAARTVGWALHSLPTGTKVPWHRVINSQGRISISGKYSAEVQAERLRAEGIKVDKYLHVDLKKYLWQV